MISFAHPYQEDEDRWVVADRLCSAPRCMERAAAISLHAPAGWRRRWLLRGFCTRHLADINREVRGYRVWWKGARR